MGPCGPSDYGAKAIHDRSHRRLRVSGESGINLSLGSIAIQKLGKLGKTTQSQILAAPFFYWIIIMIQWRDRQGHNHHHDHRYNHDDHQMGRSMERSSSGDRLGGLGGGLGGRAAKTGIRRGSITEEARSGGQLS